MLTVQSLASNRRTIRQLVRHYNFASTRYKECFGGLPIADGVKLRQDTIDYLDTFDPQSWYSDPVTSIVNGKYANLRCTPLLTYSSSKLKNG